MADGAAVVAAPFAPLDTFLKQHAGGLPAGVTGVLLADTHWHLEASLDDLTQRGVASVLVLSPEGQPLRPHSEGRCPVHAIAIGQTPWHEALNRLSAALPKRWLLWLHPGEFLRFPFCETRSVADLTDFLESERRRVLYCYCFDLYAVDMPIAEEDPRRYHLWMDRLGYAAFPGQEGRLTLYGGLGWRFEEVMPEPLAPIGRPTLFRADPDVQLGPDLTFADLAYASVSCPWHHSPTGGVLSLRLAKSLFAQPGFPGRAGSLFWQGSFEIDWTAQQLMTQGFIEPGQWF